jgi:hypothetical protein
MEIQTQLQEMIKYYNDKEGHEKHLKGYMYDSLVFRYQLALYKASLKDAEDIMIREGISKKEAEAKARRNYERDLMRFIQILDEAIGEHD